MSGSKCQCHRLTSSTDLLKYTWPLRNQNVLSSWYRCPYIYAHFAHENSKFLPIWKQKEKQDLRDPDRVVIAQTGIKLFVTDVLKTADCLNFLLRFFFLIIIFLCCFQW